jgi:hypothetical protein
VSFLNARLVIVSGHHFGERPYDVKAYTLVADALRAGMHATAFPPTLEEVDILLGAHSDLSTMTGGIASILNRYLPAFFESQLRAA